MLAPNCGIKSYEAKLIHDSFGSESISWDSFKLLNKFKKDAKCNQVVLGGSLMQKVEEPSMQLMLP